MTFLKMVENDVFSLVISPGSNFPEELDRESCFEMHSVSKSLILGHNVSKDQIINDPFSMVIKTFQMNMQDSGPGKRHNAKPKDPFGCVYVMRNKRNGYTKIGFTTGTPEYRESTLQSQEPEIELISHYPAFRSDEKFIHENFSSFRLRGEWFDLNGDQLIQVPYLIQASQRGKL